MTKKELRLNFTTVRNSLSKEEIHSSTTSIFKHLEALPIWDYTYYHVYLSIVEKKELDTTALLNKLFNKRKKVIVPKISNSSNLKHFELRQDTQLVKNNWGIPEPESGTQVTENLIDLVFVPLLAFDSQGHRVGYGKGYYDRFLSQCRKDVVKIGLSLFDPVQSISDIEETDIRLDYCVTPDRIYSF